MVNKLFLAILGFSYASFSCDYMINTFASKSYIHKSIERVAKKYNSTTSAQFNNKEFSDLPLSMKIAVFLTKYRIHVDTMLDDICTYRPIFSPENEKYRNSIYEVIPSELMRAFFKIDYENIFDLKRYCPIEQWTQANFNYLTLLAFIKKSVIDKGENSVQNVLMANMDNKTYRKYETKFKEAEHQIKEYTIVFEISYFIAVMKQIFNKGTNLNITNSKDQIICKIQNSLSIRYDKVFNKITRFPLINYDYYSDLKTYYKKYHICSESDRANILSLIEGYMNGIYEITYNDDINVYLQLKDNKIIQNIKSGYILARDSLVMLETYVECNFEKSICYSLSSVYNMSAEDYNYENKNNSFVFDEDIYTENDFVTKLITAYKNKQSEQKKALELKLLNLELRLYKNKDRINEKIEKKKEAKKYKVDQEEQEVLCLSDFDVSFDISDDELQYVNKSFEQEEHINVEDLVGNYRKLMKRLNQKLSVHKRKYVQNHIDSYKARLSDKDENKYLTASTIFPSHNEPVNNKYPEFMCELDYFERNNQTFREAISDELIELMLLLDENEEEDDFDIPIEL